MQPYLSTNQCVDAKALEHEPRLPTYEEATRQRDCSKLPSYSINRRARFHPYPRYFPSVDVIGRFFVSSFPVFFLRVSFGRLFAQNTVFDEEYVPLHVPRARIGAGRRIPPLVRPFLRDKFSSLNTVFRYLRRRNTHAFDVTPPAPRPLERCLRRLQTVICVSYNMPRFVSTHLTLGGVGLHPRY